MFSTLYLAAAISLATPTDNPTPVTQITLPDGGQMVLATTKQYPEIENEISLIRTNAAGEKVWSKTYGGTGYDRASSFLETDNGDFIIVGETSSWGVGNFDIYIIRINAEGEELWRQVYGEEFNDYSHTIQSVGNGQYEVRGTQQQCEDHSFSTPCLVLPWVLTIDGSGTLLSEEMGENINGNAEEEAPSVEEEVPVLTETTNTERLEAEEFLSEAKGLLYPNPTTDRLIFRQGDWEGETVTFSIVDLNGRIMDTQSQRLAGGKATLQVSQLPTGAYILRAVSPTGQAAQYRFVKE